MHSTRIRPFRVPRRFHWPARQTGFMTPLPPRRDRYQGMPMLVGKEWQVPMNRRTHTPLTGALRHIVVLFLWLLIAMAMILLFAEVAH